MNVSNWYRDIREFMESAGQTVHTKPTHLSADDAHLRARLIMEEAFETCHALGVQPVVNGEPIAFVDMEFVNFAPTHLLGLVDGCCDLIVVALGTLVTAGLPDEPFMDEVNQNNLSKVKPVAKIVNGKIQKPDGYTPPNLSQILLNLYDQGEEQ